MARGIHNLSTVACHLSSAIQIFCYTLPSLRDAIVQVSHYDRAVLANIPSCDKTNMHQHTSSLAIVVELGKLFTALMDDDASESVDPSRFFALIENECNPHDLGDATRSMSVLLRIMRSLFEVKERSSSNINTVAEKLHTLYQFLLSGTIEQVVMGKKVISKEDGFDIVTRHKQKIRPLPCPLPLDGSCHSVIDAIYDFLKPVDVSGYRWDGATEYVESTIHNGIGDTIQDMNVSLDEWTTTKQISFQSLPKVLLLHLQRFVYRNGNLTPSGNTLRIPMQFDLGGVTSSSTESSVQPRHYELLGCILHLEEKDDDDTSNEQEDSEGGHYVALYRDGSSIDGRWVLVNDEKVSEMSEESAEELLQSRGDAPMRATLLVYATQLEHAAVESILRGLRETLASSERNMENDAYEVVGKRLQILWAKGKYYPGKITFYDPSSGKHRVEYDDGDVKEYRLHKKVIQWEDD